MAQETQIGPLVVPVELHGFVSQGFILSTKNNYLAESTSGSFEFSEVGFNVTKYLTDDFKVGMQLFAHDLGAEGNYTPQFDWFCLDYRFFDWLGIRAGRTKIPFGLYNEINDIDAARVPILLPQSIYPTNHRSFLLAQTGVELYGNLTLGAAGDLEYRAYGGTIFLGDPKPPNELVTVRKLEVPYVFGGRLMWMTPLDGLQIGGSFQALRLDTDLAFVPAILPVIRMQPNVPDDFDGVLPTQFPLKLWVASIEYAAHDLQLAAEYSRWAGTIESGVPEIQPNIEALNERYYVLAAYRVRWWFTPGVYYSGYFVNADDRHGREAYTHDFAGTLRFDLTPNWLLKLEGHFMRGTAALKDSPNDGKELHELVRDWTLLMIKTTGFF